MPTFHWNLYKYIFIKVTRQDSYAKIIQKKISEEMERLIGKR